MASAGGSAQGEFERRNKHARESRRSHLGFKATLVVFVPVVLYLVTGNVLNALSINSSPLSLLPAFVALLVFLRLLAEWSGRRQTTVAWKKGAEGERRTARDLARLPAAFVVTHDLRIPGSRANIDHLVVGPTGVFTIETKNYSNDLNVKGKAAAAVARQAGHQAEVASELLGVRVTPLVCVRGASVTGSLWFKPRVAGVLFRSPANLNRTLMRAKGTFSTAEVERLSQLARTAFPT